jgi:hypothetical protein
MARLAREDVNYVPSIKNRDTDFDDMLFTPSTLEFRVDGHNESVLGDFFGGMSVLGRMGWRKSE